jgi:hypothetical protein
LLLGYMGVSSKKNQLAGCIWTLVVWAQSRSTAFGTHGGELEEESIGSG